MVAGIAALHLAIDVISAAPVAVPAGIPVALLLVPVSYAALRYGLSGSVATAAWATVLWLPDLLLPHDRGHFGNDGIELALVIAVADALRVGANLASCAPSAAARVSDAVSLRVMVARPRPRASRLLARVAAT